jgi:hypothetical protein
MVIGDEDQRADGDVSPEVRTPSSFTTLVRDVHREAPSVRCAAPHDRGRALPTP